jgi:3',5'-cyclic AMP phosphodiesterase CpdA
MAETGFVRLLHITDLHARSKSYPTDVDHKVQLKGRAVGQERDAAFRSMLRAELRRRKEKEENWPRAILVTGDVVNMGGVDNGEFARACNFLKAVADDLKIDHKRVFVVPGNHDVTWDPKLGLGDKEKFQAFMEAMSDFILPQFKADTLMPFITSDLSNIRDGVEIELTLLVSPTYSGIADPLGEKLIKHLEGRLPDFTPEQRKEIEKTVIEAHTILDVAALGTEQRSHIADSPAPSAETVRIALMHHHLLPHPQIEVTTFEAVLDAGQTLQMLIEERYDLVVHGHKHFPHLAKYINESRRGVHVYAGPSLFEDSTGFAFIDVYGPRGTHDIRLTQFGVDYRARQIREQFSREIDRDGRVLTKVFTLASEVPTDVQERVVQPLLENLTEVLKWREEYADKKMFDGLWQQVSYDLSEIGKRRVTFKPDYIDEQLSALLEVISQSKNATIRMVSDDNLEYWMGAELEDTPAYEYRMALKNFGGGKTRIVIAGDRLDVRDERYITDLNSVVEQMVGDGFTMAVVRNRRVPRAVARDFGIYGKTAVGFFDRREGLSRHLTLNFNQDDVQTYDKQWGLLLAARDVMIKVPGAFAKWLSRELNVDISSLKRGG